MEPVDLPLQVVGRHGHAERGRGVHPFIIQQRHFSSSSMCQSESTEDANRHEEDKGKRMQSAALSANKFSFATMLTTLGLYVDSGLHVISITLAGLLCVHDYAYQSALNKNFASRMPASSSHLTSVSISGDDASFRKQLSNPFSQQSLQFFWVHWHNRLITAKQWHLHEHHDAGIPIRVAFCIVMVHATQKIGSSSRSPATTRNFRNFNFKGAGSQPVMGRVTGSRARRCGRSGTIPSLHWQRPQSAAKISREINSNKPRPLWEPVRFEQLLCRL
eukprot:2885931-Rhodomonas_salina.1